MRKLALAGALALAGLSTGCLGGGRAEPEYFTLSPSAASSAPVAAKPELGLVLGQVELPRYLDRAELVTRDGPVRLQVWGGARWGGSLRSDVQRVVADDLGRLLGTARVVVYPSEPRFVVGYRIALELIEFGGPRSGPVTLRARWTVAGGLDGRALAVGETSVEETPASPGWDAWVGAHSAALGTVTREIAERIASLP